MFEFVRNNQRIAQLILAILIVPFAFFGLDSYFRGGAGGGEVAKIAGTPVYQVEFDRALREQQDRLREATDGQANQALLNSPQVRRAVLEDLVNRRVLLRYVDEMRVAVSPLQLRQTIASIPAFQDEKGEFSLERYEAVLARQRTPLTPAMFEAQVAQDTRIQQLVLSVRAATLVAKESARRLLAAQIEGRTVREWRFPLASYRARVKIEEATIQKYYDDNGSRYERPERVKAEYVVFDEATLRDQVEVSAEDVREKYDTDIALYTTPEQRRVRHILILVAQDAEEAEVAAAQARIDEIAALLKARPARFAELARERSQDPGSTAQGGDLGVISRDGYDKAFVDAAFSAKKDAISAPVRSDFGFHLIQVTDIRAESVKSFASVRDEIATELRKQAAGQRFSGLADKFSSTVHEQSDSLAPVAEELGLKVQTTDWLDRNNATIGAYRNSELINALFSTDAVEGRYNTKAVDVAPNVLVSARVVEHEPAQRLPLETVRAAIEEQLRREEALRLAREAGADTLAKLEKGEAVEEAWSAGRSIQRMAPQLPGVAARAVFAAPVSTLPARLGVELPNDAYVIYQIDAVDHPVIADDDPRLADVANQYGQIVAERDFAAFLDTLRTRYQVEIFTPAESKDE
ncbi:peptidylprolyl isomerase [Betaproteobacteria bacterium]|nr:peptidylprolyl isomerase [Betaproteobacteria bacterium]